MKNSNFATKLNDLLIYGYFGLFLLYSVLPPFALIYAKYSLPIELVILSLILILNYRLIKMTMVEKMLAVSLMGFALFSVIFTNGGIGSFLNLLHFLIGTIIFSTIRLKARGSKRLLILCGVIWLFNLALSPTAWSLYEIGEALYNPNTIGIAIFFTSTILIHYFREMDKKIPILLVMAFSIGGIVLSQCRSALIAEIIYTIIVYVPIFEPVIMKFKNLVLGLTAVGGMLFPMIYTKLYASHIGPTFLYSSKGFFTGRQVIWKQMLSVLNSDKVNYITGLGTNNAVVDGEAIDNYHNWYLGMLYTFGIPTLLLYFLIFVRAVRKIISYDVFCAVLGLMIIGFFETVALFGLTQTYIFIYFLIGRGKEKTKEGYEK